ncbi:MAG: polysaccharide biosynthesis/export family protein [Thermoguttaceae bacterium]
MNLPEMNRFSRLGSRLVAAALLAALSAGGCADHRYCVANLPREYLAPGAVNMEEVNIGKLTERGENPQLIQRGDVLEVSLITDFAKLTSTTTPVRVGVDGTVAVPLIGPVGVAGRTLEDAERIIGREGINRGIFRAPSVTVTMKEQRKNRVTVVGAVNKPGTYELSRGCSSFASAVAAAEGLSKTAGPMIEIRHARALSDQFARPPVAGGAGSDAALAAYREPVPIPPVIKINLAEVPENAPIACPVEDGDVVYVSKRVVKPIHVLGLVNKPGEYEFNTNSGIRLLDAIALAGGDSNPVTDQVLLLREVPGKPEPIKISLSIQTAKRGPDNIPLAPGDTVYLEQTPATVIVDVLRKLANFGVSVAPAVP